MTITNIEYLASRALLAQAAYAKTESADDLFEELRKSANFTQTQVAAFNQQYVFVSTQPNETNGFSATVFLERATNKLIFAARGTELPGGILSDGLSADLLGIGAFGYANFQAASMYRYWRRLTTPADQPVEMNKRGQVRILLGCLGDIELAPGSFPRTMCKNSSTRTAFRPKTAGEVRGCLSLPHLSSAASALLRAAA